MQLKGIGRWSAEYILLRGLGRLNIFPADDIAAAKNLRQWLGIDRGRQQFGYDEIRATLQKWDPLQGLVYFHLLLASLAGRGWLDSVRPLAAEDNQGIHAQHHVGQSAEALHGIDDIPSTKPKTPTAEEKPLE